MGKKEPGGQAVVVNGDEYHPATGPAQRVDAGFAEPEDYDFAIVHLTDTHFERLSTSGRGSALPGRSSLRRGTGPSAFRRRPVRSHSLHPPPGGRIC